MAGYEMFIDNAKIQVHCHEVDPTPTPDYPPGDYELRIYPTLMTEEGSPDSSHVPFIVGTASTALIDGSDSSYGWATWLRTVKGVYPIWSDLDPTPNTYYASWDPLDFTLEAIDPAWINTIACRFRAKAVESDAIIGLQLFAQSGKLLSNPSYGPHSPLAFNMGAGVWHNFEWGVHDNEYDTTGWAPDGIQSALSIGSYLYFRTVPLNPSDNSLLFDYNIQVSEQYIVMYFTIP